MTEIDQTDSQTIQATITLNEATTTHEFEVSLTCKWGTECHLPTKDDWYLPPTLDIVQSDCSEYYQDSIYTDETSWEEVWQVPFRYYRLTGMKMWLGQHKPTGFEVSYNVPDDENFENWPDLTHQFGY